VPVPLELSVHLLFYCSIVVDVDELWFQTFLKKNSKSKPVLWSGKYYVQSIPVLVGENYSIRKILFLQGSVTMQVPKIIEENYPLFFAN